MPFYDHTQPLYYDYAQATNGLAEKLQAYMDLAASHPAGSAPREGIRGTAQQVYENWRRLATEAGAMKPEDDARFQTILAQWL